VLEDIMSFPTMCGNPNYADILHVEGGIKAESENCRYYQVEPI